MNDLFYCSGMETTLDDIGEILDGVGIPDWNLFSDSLQAKADDGSIICDWVTFDLDSLEPAEKQELMHQGVRNCFCISTRTRYLSIIVKIAKPLLATYGGFIGCDEDHFYPRFFLGEVEQIEQSVSHRWGLKL